MEVVAACVLLLLLASCSNLENAVGPPIQASPDPFQSVRNTDLRARTPIYDVDDRAGGASDARTASGSRSVSINPASRPLLYPGTERELPAAESNFRTAQGKLASNEPGAIIGAYGVELNFENADIQEVAKSILGDVLGLNFLIDPRVQGTVTLASVGSIPRRDLLTVFESALRASNAAVMRDGKILKIVPLSESNGSGSVSVGGGEPGFGVSVVPLRYTSATMMAKLADNFLARPGAMRADAAHNLVLIQGTTAEREAALDMIASFDIEWLRNQSVGVYPLKAATPEQMMRELQPIFENVDGGRGDGVIRFQPVTRMNAVMAIAKSPKVLEQATVWIGRLDRSDSVGTSLRTFRLKYGDAKQAVAILNNIFVGQSGSGTTLDTPHDQTAPGARTIQARLDSLGGSNASPGNGAGTATAGGPVAGGLGISTSLNQNRAGAQLAAAFESFSDKKNSSSGPDSGVGAPISVPSTRGVLPNVRISADVPNNAVVVYSNEEDYRIIDRALNQIDRPRLQVAIEATVAEVELTDELQFGVQYFLQSHDVGLGHNKGSVGLSNAPVQPSSSNTASSAATAAASLATSLLSRVVPGFNLLFGPEANPRVILNALSTLTNVKVLSSPSIVALDNQPALLAVGDQIPITTSSATILASSATPVVNTIEMQNTGVILKVLPHIHPNGTIQLEIDQEISNVVNPEQQTLTPTISERHIHSTVALDSRQTVLLGGLISEQDQTTRSGIPGLQQINWLGYLFGNTSRSKQRTEIIIFIRPELIRNAYDAQRVSEEFRERLDFMRRTTSVVDGPRPPIKVTK